MSDSRVILRFLGVFAQPSHDCFQIWLKSQRTVQPFPYQKRLHVFVTHQGKYGTIFHSFGLILLLIVLYQ